MAGTPPDIYNYGQPNGHHQQRQHRQQHQRQLFEDKEFPNGWHGGYSNTHKRIYFHRYDQGNPESTFEVPPEVLPHLTAEDLMDIMASDFPSLAHPNHDAQPNLLFNWDKMAKILTDLRSDVPLNDKAV